MPTKTKQYPYPTPCGDDYNGVRDTVKLADPTATVCEKLADLHMGVTPEVPARRLLSILQNSFVSSMFYFRNRYGIRPSVQSSSGCLSEKEQIIKNPSTAPSPRIPIFETNRNGKGQLMVPLENSYTDDDITLPPPGLYEEDLSFSAACPRRERKRRKETSKANHHKKHGSSECKNRKEKKQHARRSEQRNVKQALSLDDYYSVYREARHDNAMDVQSWSPRWPLAGSSPSSAGSVGSFHDAMQDCLAVQCLQLHSSYDNVQAIPVSDCDPQQTHATKQTLKAVPSVSPSTGNTIPDQEKRTCGIRKAISYVIYGDDDDTSCGGNKEDTRDDGTSYDGSDWCEDDSDDDFSIVFCQDIDDLHEDSNSSSGFDEKKVRFNSKPVVHIMRVWNFAYRQARKGDWETTARDNERFQKRIAELEPVLTPALQPALRDKIYAERFSGQEHTRNPASS
uniref:PP1c_bdg domain-containing protein n=1 Tax=Anopheles minimus TaxID=112268 RepID=A0A182WMK0_9DIPT